MKIKDVNFDLTDDQASVLWSKVTDLYFKKKEIELEKKRREDELKIIKTELQIKEEKKRNLFKEAQWEIWKACVYELERIFGKYDKGGYDKFSTFLGLMKPVHNKKRLEVVDEPSEKPKKEFKTHPIPPPRQPEPQLHLF